MNLGEFRELTEDLPDDWPMVYLLQVGGGSSAHPADASVNLTEHEIQIGYWLTPSAAATASLPKRNTEEP